MSDLFTPPKYFKNVTFQRHTDRSVGWLELFYDLVYVATLIQIGNFLSDNLTLLGFAQFIVMMAVVWWAWTGETYYQNIYVSDDLIHRVLVFAQIFAVASMGLSVSAAFGDLYIQFTLAYVITRLMLVIMFWRASKYNPDNAPAIRAYMIGFSIGIVIWLGSLLLPAEIHWVGWLVGIAFELSIPFIPAVRQKATYWTADFHHLAERFGIFTIIVLGESFVKILEDSQGQSLGMQQIYFSTAGLLVLYSLWWLYFSDTDGQVVDFSNQLKTNLWSYSHLPLSASLVAFGVAAKKLFAETFKYPGDPATEKYRLLYTAAIVIFLVALALIDYGLDDEKTTQNQMIEAIVHMIGAIIVLVIGLTMTGLTATQFVGMVAVVMVAQVLYSIYLSSREQEVVDVHHT